MLCRTFTRRLVPFRPSGRSCATVGSSDPYRWPAHTHPTPYEILEIPPNGAYTKTRYLELIKLYHPDHHHHHHHPEHHHRQPHAHHLERFRLAVSANRLLSDPSRRAVYDRYGAGWQHPPARSATSQPFTPQSTKWWQEREGHSPFSSEFAHAYGRGGPDDTAANSTWEDWERWRAARAGNPSSQQQPLLTSNGAFVAFVIVLAFVGSLAELNYVGGRSEQIVELGERRSILLSQDLARRRREAGMDGRDERVRRFLIMRDPVDAGRRFRHALDDKGVDGKLFLPTPSPPPPPPPPSEKPPPPARHAKGGGE